MQYQKQVTTVRKTPKRFRCGEVMFNEAISKLILRVLMGEVRKPLHTEEVQMWRGGRPGEGPGSSAL